MDLQYYVLGKKDNPMLTFYLDKYELKLKELLLFLEKKGILRKLISELLSRDCKDFIIAPDISALINTLYKQICLEEDMYLWNSELYIQKLWKEIQYFLDWDQNLLTANKGSLISWTQIRLTIEDINPYNQLDAHPDHRANWWILWWWQASDQDWLQVYSKTFDILKKADEWTYDELNRIIRKIIPLGTALGTHNSASYKECIGHLYMGYTIDSKRPEINNLEAIIHESSHNKLNLIMHFDPLVLNTREEIYYSPYRPDARHIHGIYLGVHAIAPTVFVLLRSYIEWLFWDDSFWLHKIILFHLKNKIWLKVLQKYAKLTNLWKEIFEEMQYVIWLSDTLLKSLSIKKELLLQIQAREKEHFNAVNKNYPRLKY